jgi:hypothetical protein
MVKSTSNEALITKCFSILLSPLFRSMYNFLSTLLSNTVSSCVSFNANDQVLHEYKPKLANYKSKSKLCYDRRSAGQSVLEQSTHLGLRPDLDYCLTVAGLLIWGALSNERTGLSFAIANGPRQRSHFWVRVLYILTSTFFDSI